MQILANNKRKLPTKEGLKVLYVDMKLPIREIARRCGLKGDGSFPVLNAVRRAGLWRPERSSTPILEGYKDKAVAMYVDEKLACKTIAQKFGCSAAYVRRFLIHNGVTMRPTGARRRDTCKVEGCKRPPTQTWHVKLKCFYGTRCEFHEGVYKAEASRKSYRTRTNLPKEKWRTW